MSEGAGCASPRVSTHRRSAVVDFELVSTEAGACATPCEVDFASAIRARAPGTVARALADAGRLDLSHPPPLDARDHWYRARLPRIDGQAAALICEGLATLAEIWIDGALRGRSESMFVPHETLLSEEASERELVLCFRALAPELARRRPRPRWRTRLVTSQNLRFVRTSLLGRMPGLGPSVPPVGPYRPLYLEQRQGVALGSHTLTVCAERGTVALDLALDLLDPAALITPAELVVHGAAGTGRAVLTAHREGARVALSGEVALAGVQYWWPHTHGTQPLSDVVVQLGDGTTIALGRVGMRTLSVDRGPDGAGFGLSVNGVPVFARGACLTTTDFLTLGTTALDETLRMARRAGMNMLRVPGIAAYAPLAFHDLCDEFGLMVFQDFMFANMDYPAGDAAFDAAVTAEASALLTRIGARPSTVVLCGGSEVAQQAAMLGLSEASRTSPLFDETLARMAAARAPSAVYVPNSPTGGALPFHVDEGIGHYYGVGAYLRPLADARLSRVRFAAECLAFANVPHPDTVDALLGDIGLALHHPRWKERVPRDMGAGWDFEDVRDHYIERLFDVEARALRATYPERYLALGHAAVGEAIAATYGALRARDSGCAGALIFWLRDHWEGAGLGLVDATGLPKSAYYFAARSFRSIHIALTDEGLNGLHVQLANDTECALAAELRVVLYRDGEVPIAEGRGPLTVAPRARTVASVDRLLGRFADPSYAYRFGPPAHDLVVATLLHEGAQVARAYHLPLGLARPLEADLGLQGVLAEHAEGAQLTVATRKFAQCVSIDVPGYLPEDDFFHLAPGEVRTLSLHARAQAAGRMRGRLSALNARTTTALGRASDSPEGAS